jgi:hypothetical protein
MTEEEVRRIVLGMKGCLDPSHIACERCSPGFTKRMEKISRELYPSLYGQSVTKDSK